MDAGPAFGHHFPNDIFISYPRILDRINGQSGGWVTAFKGHLENYIRQKVPRDRTFRIWMDESNLRGNQEVEATILDALQNSAVILIVMSGRYGESEWCEWELESCREFFRRRAVPGAPIFVIQYEDVEAPPPLDKLKGYQFWENLPGSQRKRTLGYPVPNPNIPTHTRFWERLQDLGDDLIAELTELGPGTDSPPPPSHSPSPVLAESGDRRPTVFLAEPSSDVRHQHLELYNNLSSQGLRVLPSPREPYSRDDAEALERALKRDLGASRLFVQVLGLSPGRRAPGTIGKSTVVHQFEQARDRFGDAAVYYQWRSGELDPDEAENPDYQALLKGKTVSTESLVDFAQRVHDAATSPTQTPAPRKDRFYVICVNPPGEKMDDLAETVGRNLHQSGHTYTLLAGPEQPATPLLDSTSNYHIYVYDATRSKINPIRLSGFVRYEFNPALSMQLICLYDGQQEPETSFHSPNIHYVNAPGMTRERLQQVLDTLRRKEGFST